MRVCSVLFCLWPAARTWHDEAETKSDVSNSGVKRPQALALASNVGDSIGVEGV